MAVRCVRQSRASREGAGPPDARPPMLLESVIVVNQPIATRVPGRVRFAAFPDECRLPWRRSEWWVVGNQRFSPLPAIPPLPEN